MTKTKRNILFCGVLSALLTGCVNTVKQDEFAVLQQQVNSLSEENSRLRNELGKVKTSVAEVKDRKFVQLPTGSPTQVEARKKVEKADGSKGSSDQSTDGLVDNDLSTYQSALATYKSGDIANGVMQLANYRKTYPNGKKFEEASYYLAQAYYAERNYNYAAMVLEPLVFDRPREDVNLSIAKLLRKVYQAGKNAEKLTELDALMTPESVPVEATESATGQLPAELSPNTAPETTPESATQ